MSAISSKPSDVEPVWVGSSPLWQRLNRSRLADVLLVAFWGAMLWGMYARPGQETVPYHLLFLSFTAVYGFRVWPLPTTLVVLAGLTLTTGWIMIDRYRAGEIDAPELAEIPLMPALVVAMAWHARRRAEGQWRLHRMAEERQALLDRQGDLFRDTSHAIRTPVTIARGHLELTEQGDLAPDAREDIGVALRQLDRMTLLSNRLLTLAQLDAGAAPPVARIGLKDFVAEVGRNWATGDDRQWRVSCAEDASFLADPELVRLAVDALIENAVRFTEGGGRIDVTGEVTPTACCIRVADDGPGVDQDDLDHLFERFWHRRPVHGPMGSGLGLAMAQATARAYGGTLSVHNRTPRGAVFEFSVPRQGAGRS
jgi:signal transduction histidine kinase